RSEPNAHLPSVPRTEFPTRRSMRMMTSVSILLRMIGAATAVIVLNGFGMSAPHGADVGDGAGDRCGGGARGACQMCARPRSLTANEIAVGCRNRALSGGNRLAIGGETHRAAGLAPFESGLGEDLVEAFRHRVALDVFRTRHHPGLHAGRHFP